MWPKAIVVQEQLQAYPAPLVAKITVFTALSDSMVLRMEVFTNQWAKSHKLNMEKVLDSARKMKNEIVQFPVTHDITPPLLKSSIAVIHTLLEGNNRVIIVTKPWRQCIQGIIEEFGDYKDRIELRISITTLNESQRILWEPGAPTVQHRLECLQIAFEKGFQTGASISPMLDIVNVVELFKKIEPLVTEKIWMGRMARVKLLRAEGNEKRMVDIERLKKENSDTQLLASVYNELKDNPKFATKHCAQEHLPWGEDE